MSDNQTPDDEKVDYEEDLIPDPGTRQYLNASGKPEATKDDEDTPEHESDVDAKAGYASDEGSEAGEVKQPASEGEDFMREYEPPSYSSSDDERPRWMKDLQRQVPGCDPCRAPWSNLLMSGTMERLEKSTEWSVVEWVGAFLEWRSIRGKRPVDKDDFRAVSASWRSYTEKALSGGVKAVEALLTSARKRAEHDSQHSVTGIKQSIHDLCDLNGVVCRVFFYENACNSCGFMTFNNIMFLRRVEFSCHALEAKLAQYEKILRTRQVDWRANFETNIRGADRVRLAIRLPEAPKSQPLTSNLASARDNTSREVPAGDSAKYDSRGRESLQPNVESHRKSQSPVAVVDARSDFDFAMEEERDLALQNYDPDEKLRRFEGRSSAKIARFEKTVATLESCVQTFATGLRQVTERCERLERALKIRVDGQDSLLKSQHLRIQELEGWRQEQRHAAAKRRREESSQVALGPAQTLRRKESLDPQGVDRQG